MQVKKAQECTVSIKSSIICSLDFFSIFIVEIEHVLTQFKGLFYNLIWKSIIMDFLYKTVRWLCHLF